MMFWYLVIINFITFILYFHDKHLAIKNKYRLSEYTLFVFSFFGGSLGALFGMKLAHHKTKKKSFWLFNFFMLFIWIFFLLSL